MTLKELVYKILLEKPETRDSDKKLIWEVWKKYILIEPTLEYGEIICYSYFMKAPSPESIRRVRQQLQREDLLTGTKLIQPTRSVKEKRVKLSREKGASYMMGKEPVTLDVSKDVKWEQWQFDEVSQTYRQL